MTSMISKKKTVISDISFEMGEGAPNQVAGIFSPTSTTARCTVLGVRAKGIQKYILMF